MDSNRLGRVGRLGVLGSMLALLLFGCAKSDVTCGPGTVLEDGQCVVATAGRSGGGGEAEDTNSEAARGGTAPPSSGGASGGELPANGGSLPSSGGGTSSGGASGGFGGGATVSGGKASSGGEIGLGGDVQLSGGSGGQAGSSDTAGRVEAGGRVVVPTDCGSNLLDGDLGPDNNWIGQDPASVEDNPCGVQGSIYVYGDGGLSGCTPEEGSSPCRVDELGRVKCCISGTTIIDKPEYKAWGCGLGVTLNAPTRDGPHSPYAGPARGFRFALTGTTSGQDVRVSYTQVADTSGICSPFLGGEKWGPSVSLITGEFLTEMGFEDVACPSGSNRDCGCSEGSVPYTLDIQVTGGDKAGSFNICLTELVPLPEELPSTGECPSGRTLCGSNCCVPPTVCGEEGCPPVCFPGYEACGDRCMTATDYAYDLSNCGSCGHICADATVERAACISGVCGCLGGYTLCNGNLCADLTSDSENCGTCGTQCPSGVCSNRTCMPAGTGGAGQGGTGQGGTANNGGGGIGAGGRLGVGGDVAGNAGQP